MTASENSSTPNPDALSVFRDGMRSGQAASRISAINHADFELFLLEAEALSLLCEALKHDENKHCRMTAIHKISHMINDLRWSDKEAYEIAPHTLRDLIYHLKQSIAGGTEGDATSSLDAMTTILKFVAETPRINSDSSFGAISLGNLKSELNSYSHRFVFSSLQVLLEAVSVFSDTERSFRLTIKDVTKLLDEMIARK